MPHPNPSKKKKTAHVVKTDKMTEYTKLSGFHPFGGGDKFPQ
jgi:hypothetical protein